ncbi:hypothetical protein GCM10022377_25000 [Zhihengliuella alba]|uniref:Uncharacterized protein n=1 Tax=Zhihengliuella alba TaxID=547018 RepID=A0ABP7DXN4_9MICC
MDPHPDGGARERLAQPVLDAGAEPVDHPAALGGVGAVGDRDDVHDAPAVPAGRREASVGRRGLPARVLPGPSARSGRVRISMLHGCNLPSDPGPGRTRVGSARGRVTNRHTGSL